MPGEWKQLEESIQKNEEATLALAHVLETYKKACRMQEFSPIKSFANCWKSRNQKKDIDHKDPEPDPQNGVEKSEAVKRMKKSNKKEKKLKNLKRMSSQGFNDEFR